MRRISTEVSKGANEASSADADEAFPVNNTCWFGEVDFSAGGLKEKIKDRRMVIFCFVSYK